MSDHQHASPKYDFEKRLGSLLSMDKNRIQKFLEFTQYGIIYVLLAFPIGSAIDSFFEIGEVTVKMESNAKILFSIILQSIICIIAVFYMRKIAELFPFFFQMTSNYHAFENSEYHGEIIIAIIFATSQFNLGKRVLELHNRLKDRLLGK